MCLVSLFVYVCTPFYYTGVNPKDISKVFINDSKKTNSWWHMFSIQRTILICIWIWTFILSTEFIIIYIYLFDTSPYSFKYPHKIRTYPLVTTEKTLFVQSRLVNPPLLFSSVRTVNLMYRISGSVTLFFPLISFSLLVVLT